MPNDPTEITVHELKERLDAGEDIFVLDVRTHMEWFAGRLADTDRRISYDTVPDFLNQLPSDRTTSICVYCRSGRRSRLVTDYLRAIGYTAARNLSGGVIAWHNAGYKLIAGE
ncbi:hypothetical protein GF420_11405 [candidate division GN15 bacterium]|nr:hypothetical protein [candidate division GN15 bacterium]